MSQQIEGVERSMVFLRKEHLSMLHGLHLEILSLQKRCTGEGFSAAVAAVFESKALKKLYLTPYFY